MLLCLVVERLFLLFSFCWFSLLSWLSSNQKNAIELYWQQYSVKAGWYLIPFEHLKFRFASLESSIVNDLVLVLGSLQIFLPMEVVKFTVFASRPFEVLGMTHKMRKSNYLNYYLIN